MFAAGEMIGRYEVVALLGEGGMAVVYQVRHQTLNTSHALKVLTLRSKSIQDRLVEEGRLQGALKHPNIVRLTDVLEVDGCPALLMEFVGGISLAQLLLGRRLPLDEALILFRQVVSGVAHAHAEGLVHRDLKPANILLEPTSGGVVAKVSDFGLAKATENPDRSRTRTGVAMGTPDYMAPEQIRDAKNVDRRADLYSLGVLLYELVCGRRPHDSEDVIALYQAVWAGTYTPPAELAPGLPVGVERAITSLLAVELTARPVDALAILEILDGEMPAGSPESLPAARHPSSFSAVLPGDASTSAVVGVLAAEHRRASSTRLVDVPPSNPQVSETSGPTGAKTMSLTALDEVAEPAGVRWRLWLGLGLAAAVVALLATQDSSVRVIEAPSAAPIPDVAASGEQRHPLRVIVPTEASTAPGAFAFAGAKRVFLVNSGESYKEGKPLPPGTYDLQVVFSGRKVVDLPDVKVRGGERLMLSCREEPPECSSSYAPL